MEDTVDIEALRLRLLKIADRLADDAERVLLNVNEHSLEIGDAIFKAESAARILASLSASYSSGFSSTA